MEEFHPDQEDQRKPEVSPERRSVRLLAVRRDHYTLFFDNDNYLAWPLIPFPDGWHASC